jgi:hypothetical protein
VRPDSGPHALFVIADRIAHAVPGDVYQRTSPRLLRELVPALAVPAERILAIRELALGGGSSRVALGVSSAPDDDHLDDLSIRRRDARDGQDPLPDLDHLPEFLLLIIAVSLPRLGSGGRNRTERGGTQRQSIPEHSPRLLSQARVRARFS